MQRTMLKSKIHGARVTQTELFYEGSITIDEELMERADIEEYERVQVVNLANGARFETYVIRGGRGSKVVCLNGPAARLAEVSDTVHILSYVHLDDEELKDYGPVVLILDGDNEVVEEKRFDSSRG